MNTNLKEMELNELEMVTGGFVNKYLMMELKRIKEKKKNAAGGATGTWEAGGATGGW